MMRLIDRVQRHAVVVLGLAVLLTVACGVYSARHFAIDTNLGAMLSPDLPFEQDGRALSRAFPQLDNAIVAVLDGPTPALARDGARRLTERLRGETALFADVYRPEGEFLIRNGLLYLDPPALQEMTDRLAQAQPLIGALAADPTARGLAGLIEQATSPQAAEAGAAMSGLDPLLFSLTATVEAADRGRFQPMAWSRLMSQGSGDARQFILLQPRLDTHSLSPAGPALAKVREAAAALGLDAAHGFRLRMTGPAALDEAQIGAATEGAGGTALLCLGLMAILLGLGLQSLRLTAAILLVLAMSFVWSVAFALVAVGSFNLISVAFAVLFIGLGVDFGIQFSVRYGEDLAAIRHRRAAVRAAFLGAWRPLLLAAAAAAISFYSTVPTDYRGLAELGLIAGTSMGIAVGATLIVLPAFLSIITAGKRHAARPRYGGFGRLPIHRHRKLVVGIAAVAGLAALPFALTVGFDFDPARVQDPRAEAVQMFQEMRQRDPATFYTIDVLTPDLAAADALAERLSRLKSVSHAVTLDSYVPEAQDEKRAMIEQLAMIIPPFAIAEDAAKPLSAAEMRAALARLRRALGAVKADAPFAAAAKRLAAALDRFQAHHGADDAAVQRLGRELAGDLPQTIGMLRTVLTPDTITRESLPADLRARYVNPKTGQARVEVFSAIDVSRPENLERFVREVQSVAPHATGASVILVETGRAMVDAFRTSTILALAGICLLLFLVLRHVGRVALVLVPLCLAGVLTTATMKAFGIAFNLGNIIVLPLLIGLGVAFGIYFVLRWAEGEALDAVLRTSMPDAVLLSGLATMVSFGSMALSANPAMATLGRTLSIALFFVLVCVLLVLPAVLAFFSGRKTTP